MNKVATNIFTVGFLLVFCWVTVCTAGNESSSGEIDKIFLRLISQYPPGQYIPPDEFYMNSDVKELLLLADQNIEGLLAVGEFHRQELLVKNPLSFEQWRSHWGQLSFLTEEVHEPTKEEYEKYLDDLWRYDAARIQLERKRQMIRMVLEKKVSQNQECFTKLLQHKSTFCLGISHSTVTPSAGIKI